MARKGAETFSALFLLLLVRRWRMLKISRRQLQLQIVNRKFSAFSASRR
jgi:hypothetical protein